MGNPTKRAVQSAGRQAQRVRRAAMLAAFALGGAGSTLFAAPGVPETRTLPNGLRIVILEDHTLPLVSVSLWTHAGSKDEIETSAGYAHFLEHLVQRGTDTAGPFEYQRLAHRWGGAVSVRANYDRTSITATGVSSALEPMEDAVAGMALRAKLEDNEPWTPLTFVGPGYRNPDRPAFEILARFLGEAGGSPVARALVRDRTGTTAQVVFYRLEDAGLLYVGMIPASPEMSYAAAT